MKAGTRATNRGATGYLGESETQLYARMNDSEGAFGGGTDLDGDGIWGLEFIHSSDRVADNIRFRKSAFCFGDRVTLITTDIGRGPATGPVEQRLEFATTLYQNAFGSGGETELTGKGVGHFGTNPPRKPGPTPSEQEPCWADGRQTTGFPTEETLASGTPHWLIDNKRTGYYVHPQSPPLKLTRRQQQWNYLWRCWAKPEQKHPEKDLPKDPRNYNPTVGNFATAWFAHGAKPDVTDCVYTLFPASSPEKMQRFTQEMGFPETAPYAILHKDSRAHILLDRPSRTTGYILFQKGPVPVAGKLREVNRPCAVMIKEAGDKLRVSVASTDLDAWPTADKGKIMLSGDVAITLDGEWTVRHVVTVTPRDCHVTGGGGATTLSIPFKDFMPVVVILEHHLVGWRARYPEERF